MRDLFLFDGSRVILYPKTRDTPNSNGVQRFPIMENSIVQQTLAMGIGPSQLLPRTNHTSNLTVWYLTQFSARTCSPILWCHGLTNWQFTNLKLGNDYSAGTPHTLYCQKASWLVQHASNNLLFRLPLCRPSFIKTPHAIRALAALTARSRSY